MHFRRPSYILYQTEGDRPRPPMRMGRKVLPTPPGPEAKASEEPLPVSTIAAALPIVQAGPARRPRTGTFARPADPRAITPVKLATGAVAYRVGPMGRIYADRRAAVSFARNVEGRMLRIGGAL